MNYASKIVTGQKTVPEEVKWIRDRQRFLQLTQIELQLEIPLTTLSQVLSGKRKPDRYLPKLREFINSFQSQ